MQDLWVEMGRHPLARQVLKRVGLRPPPQLLRAYRPWSDAILTGKRLLLNQGGSYSQTLAPLLLAQNAQIDRMPDKDSAPNPMAISLATAYQGTVFDATSLQSVAELKQLFHFFKSQLRRLGFNHRVLVLIRAWPSDAAPTLLAVSQAVEGFTRSLAKEWGPKGVQVNALRIPTGDEQALLLAPIVSFFLSDYCSFVTGQVIELKLPLTRPTLPPLAGSLAGKLALVTGAAQGIGYMISRRLADEGAHVIGLDLPQNAAALKDLARTVDGESIEADLSQDLQLLIDRLQTRPQPLDIIVHNAGLTRDRTLAGMKESDWDAVLGVNLGAPVTLTLELLRRGLIAANGRVICMSSIVGLGGNFGQSNYSAAKAGLIGFVEGLAPHVQREGITVNAVAPGFIETAMTAALPMMAKQIARRLASLSQGGLPDDVAEMVCFLASPCAQGLSGRVLRVCGGHLMGR